MINYNVFNLTRDGHKLEELANLHTKFSREIKGIVEDPKRIKRELENSLIKGTQGQSIAELKDKLIGYVSWNNGIYHHKGFKTKKHIKTAEITDHFVLINYRGNLVGTYLLEFTLEYLKIEGYAQAFITIDNDNETKLKGIKYFKFVPRKEENGKLKRIFKI
jgi:hypothetical protein